MPGLSPNNYLAVSSNPQFASLLRDILPAGRFVLSIGSGSLQNGDSGTALGTHSTTTLQDTTKTWTVNQWRNFEVTVTGKGTATIISNTVDTLTFSPAITLPVNGDAYVITANVNSGLGNNFQLEWDDGGNQVVIHNDYPIYSGGVYYFMGTADPNTDTHIALGTLTGDPTPYNHLFLVNGVAGTHTGSLERVATATIAEPSTVGTKVLYLGWVYKGINNEIIIKNIGRLIDTGFLVSNVSYVDFLDLNAGLKTTIYPTNLLRYTAFFGPNIVKTIREVGLYIVDLSAGLHLMAYSKVSPAHSLIASESLRVLWNLTI